MRNHDLDAGSEDSGEAAAANETAAAGRGVATLHACWPGGQGVVGDVALGRCLSCDTWERVRKDVTHPAFEHRPLVDWLLEFL